jgi:hypothetical protein
VYSGSFREEKKINLQALQSSSSDGQTSSSRAPTEEEIIFFFLTTVFLWLWFGHINMERKSLPMPTTIFPPVELTREFAPLSEEANHIYR